jgi:hypothetical protein
MEMSMLGFIPLVTIAIVLQPGGGRLKEQRGIARVQVEGVFGITVRLLDKEDADASATILARGGEFLLDLRGCPDGQKRLNDYFKNNAGGPGGVNTTKVTASGRLEFRPRKRDKEKPDVPAPTIPVLVVASFSVLEAQSK